MVKHPALLCVWALALGLTWAAPLPDGSVGDPGNCRWCIVLLDIKPNEATVKPQVQQVLEIHPGNQALEQKETWVGVP